MGVELTYHPQLWNVLSHIQLLLRKERILFYRRRRVPYT